MAERTRRPGELPPLPQPITELDAPDAKLDAKPDAKPDPIIGTLIGDRYRIVERIGSGGMAIVYRAEHESLRKSMAVKLLLPEMAVDADMVARFEREAVAAARLDHPNCVAITDFGRTRQGRLFLVMEYIDGKPLSEVSGYGKRLPWEHAVEIARQVLRGLARAHETGIVHRDLKASNIMLVTKEGGREIAKIIDFGIAKIFDGTMTTGIPSVETQAGVVFGTADFLAPERLLGKGDLDPRSDIYSVGIILYEMVTGTRPFHDEDPYVIVKRALAEAPKPPREMAPDADIPEALEAVILKALEKPPEDRYATARDFLNALDPLGKRAQSTMGYLAGEASTQAGAATGDPQRRRGSWGMWVALIVLPIALISLGIVLAVQSSEEGDGAKPRTPAQSRAPFAAKDTNKPSGAAMTDADVARLVKEAAEGDTVEERQRAFDRLEALGYVDRVPWVEKLSKDLEQLPTCPERRDVVTQLKKLKDRKALPALQRAAARADNDCLKDQAQKAAVSLGGEEPAATPTGTSDTPTTSPKKRPPPKKSGGGGHF